MRVFIIYPFSERNYVKNFVISNKAEIEFVWLRFRYNLFWKLFSRKGISNSNFVILFIDENAERSKNIKWEIQVAKRYKKKIYKIEVQSNLKHCKEFEQFETITGEQIANIKNNYIKKNNETFESFLFNQKIYNSSNYNISFEEYKLILQTSETLIARRQTMNTFYLTANGVLISILGIVTKVSTSYLLISGFIISFLGILLSLSWKSMIKSYGQLNTGKFKVINTIEKRLPLAIFAAEWKALGEGKDKHKYLSFTKTEAKVPSIFLWFYLIIGLFIVMHFLFPELSQFLYKSFQWMKFKLGI